MPSTPPQTFRDVSSMGHDSKGPYNEFATPSPEKVSFYSPDVSLNASVGPALQRSRRTSDMSMLTTDTPFRVSYVLELCVVRFADIRLPGRT
jgi:hypothetical protein